MPDRGLGRATGWQYPFVRGASIAESLAMPAVQGHGKGRADNKTVLREGMALILEHSLPIWRHLGMV